MRRVDQLPWRSPYAILAVILGVAILLLGANFVVNPHGGATGYGVTVTSTDADAFLRCKGVRDIATGIVVLSLLAFSSARSVALALLGMLPIPIGDAIIVAMTGGAPAYAVPMHGITAVVMLVVALLILRRAPPPVSTAIDREAA